ncbi:MAG: hypothetical protein KJZ84_02950 [Bryobacteraceae bacterium]|nr:hypothetical protein [Solibacteraceae bacterium]MCL4793490.1 hypothetical protein [Bryobacteraceae bacterium]
MQTLSLKLLPIVMLGLGLPAAAGAAQAPSCAGQPRCAEVASFTAAITDFRTSTVGRNRIITTTVRFQNRLNRPLILGYVDGSGVATDDQGNRYTLYGESSVRAMGIINRQGLDPKFVLEPGQWSDARFELSWTPARNDIFGLSFVLELAVREITPLQGRQFRLGLEHALRFEGLGGETPTPAAAPASPATAAAPAAPPAPMEDACAGKPRCNHPGPFVAEIQSINASHAGTYNDHVLRISLRFRNLTDQPLVLGYSAKSSKIIDNFGNEYYWGRAGTYDTSVTGMGVVQANQANASFVLSPGESRNATFQLIRYRPGKNPIGTGFTWDLAVEQLDVLASNQVRSVRQYSLNFQDLAARTAAAGQAQNPGEAVQQLKDLFRKKK